MIERYGYEFLPLAGFEEIRLQKTERTFSICWSNFIDHGLLYPDPTEKELAAFYDTEAYRDYLSGTTSNNENAINQPLRGIAWRLDRGAYDPVPGTLKFAPTAASVCDIGCGDGAFLRKMKDLGLDVLGIDPSPHVADIPIQMGHGECLPPIDRRFDIVTMFHSLEHCRDPLLSLRNAKSLLTPDGLMVVEVPNQSCFGFKTYRQSWHHTDAGRHLHFFTPHSLAWFCGIAGLMPLHLEYSGYITQFLPWNLHSNAWSHLMRTALLERPSKYDCMRLYMKSTKHQD